MIQTNKVLYAATIEEFSKLARYENDFADELKTRSNILGISTSDQEIKSWKANCIALRKLFKDADLPKDVVVAFEYQIPVGGRIDCMLLGTDKDSKANVIHIELKQWSNENVHIKYSQYTFEVEVEGYKGGRTKFTAHPSQQVLEYQQHLLNYMNVFNEIKLVGLVYCYNYERNNKETDLLSKDYSTIMSLYPVYCKEQTSELADSLHELLSGGNGVEVLSKVLESEWKPTKRLQDVAANMFKGVPEFSLVGEQLNAYNEIIGAIKNTPKDKKSVVIVKGGPGTGKSVIAMRLVSALAQEGMFPYYVTRSTSLRNGFKQILRKAHIGNLDRAATDVIKNTFDFKPNSYSDNEVDAIIVDEAHRIENSSNWRNQSPKNRFGGPNNIFLSQIVSLLYTSRVSVFFIDDNQSITNTNVGTAKGIEDAAKDYWKRLQDEIYAFKYDVSLDGKDGKPRGIAYLEKTIEKRKKDKEKALLACNLKTAKLKESKIEELTKELEAAKKQLDFIQPTTKIDEIPVAVIELPDQFRCNGSDNYLDWLNDVIYNGGKKNIKFNKDEYEFGVFDNPHNLYNKIRSLDDYAQRVEEYKDMTIGSLTNRDVYNYFNKVLKFKPKQTARIAAGWCWDWSDKDLQPDGDLLKEVVIDGQDWDGNDFPRFEMPWETQVKPKGDFYFKYATTADTWANELEGINQVGCIFSMQGWELDYVGIIIGPDLIYDKEKNCLIANKNGGTHSVNGNEEQFDSYIKNIYRVLLTRGKKGCFIFSCDPEVGKYFKRCMNQ